MPLLPMEYEGPSMVYSQSRDCLRRQISWSLEAARLSDGKVGNI